jgi:oligopeptidase B
MSADLRDAAAPKPPVAKIAPRTTEVHGERRVDNYHWLREKENPDVRAYLEAENAYADAEMKPTEGFQQALYGEMLGRIKETDQDVPYRRGDFFYYSRTEQGKQYPIYCRRKGSLEAEEEVTLELNRLAEGRPSCPSSLPGERDADLLAYATDDTASGNTLFVKDLRGAGSRRRSRRGSARWPGPPMAGRSSTRSRKSPRSGSTGCIAIASGRPRTTSSTRRGMRRSTSASTARGACSTSSSASGA